MLVAEPTAGFPTSATRACCSRQATTEGISAHGSAPHLGRNAIYPLARAVAAPADLELAFDFPTPRARRRGETLNVGTISGGTGVNLVPDCAEAQIDVRTVPGLTGESVLDAAAPRRSARKSRSTPWIDLAPVITDPSDPWMRTVFEVAGGRAAAASPTSPTPPRSHPPTANPPTVIWGPGEAAQAHQTDECAEAAKIDAAADGFFEVARRWCHGT